MELQIFAIFDSKAEAYLQPFFAPTKQVGIRNFEHAANTPETDFFKFAGDYTLFHIGIFNCLTGFIEQMPTHENLGLALTHKKSSRTEAVMEAQWPGSYEKPAELTKLTPVMVQEIREQLALGEK